MSKPAPVRLLNKPLLADPRWIWLLGALIVIATFIAYMPAIRAGYIWDDESYVTDNLLLRDLEGLRRIWIPKQTPQYYPVVFSMFWIEYQLWELRPMGYHLVNVLLHIANALLVWRLAWRLRLGGLSQAGPGAAIRVAPAWVVGWLIAVVFALHPVHVESVAWITERKNVLSGFFYLAAALAYLRFDELQYESPLPSRQKESWGWYGSSLVLFVLALLSKSVTCSLPAALVLMMLWQRKSLQISLPLVAASVPILLSFEPVASLPFFRLSSESMRFDVPRVLSCVLPLAVLIATALRGTRHGAKLRLVSLAPYFAIGLVLALNTARIEREHVGAEGPNFAFTFADRILIASKALLFYPWKILWPVNLIFVYPRWSIDDHDWRQYWSVAVVLMITVAAVWMFIRGKRGIPLALAFFAGTIFPALGFFNVYPMIFSFVADHFQYLACLGFIVAIVGSLAWLVRSDRMLIVIGAGLIPLLGVLTWTQTLMYRDIETLWLVTISQNERAWMPRNNLSSHYLRQAELAQDQNDAETIVRWAQMAESQARAAVEIKPDHVSSWTNLSEALRLQKRYDESLAAAQKAIEFMPNIAEHHWNAARVRQLLNQPRDAIAEYQRALQLDPNYRDAHVELALLLLNDGRIDEAIAHIDAAIGSGPPNLQFMLTVGQRLDQAGRYADAVKYYRQAFAAARGDAEKIDAGYFLAQFLAMCPDKTQRSGAEAVKTGEQICNLTNRSSPFLLGALAAAYAETGRFDDAVRTGHEALILAQQANQPALAAEIQRKLTEYRAGRNP